MGHPGGGGVDASHDGAPSTTTACIAFCGWQDTAFSTDVHFADAPTVTDDEVVWAIREAKSLGQQVILKLILNVTDGTWRAVVAAVREVYSGVVTYNCDKYQESNVTWWDAVDVISSSGYYPIDDWDNQLDRIEKVVRREGKPFLFMEVGAMSTAGSQHLPNSWALEGGISQSAQRDWYEAMFAACDGRDWVGGWVLWDWKARLYALADAAADTEYALYGKLAESTVAERYSGS